MKPCRRKILVASGNPGKVAELHAMLDLDVAVVGLSDFGGIEEVEEDGVSFAANARKKALHYAQATGLWTIADDSGLCVDALDGAPGVRSARFSGVESKAGGRGVVDRANTAKLLELLSGVAEEKRTARFVCCLYLSGPDEILIETEGVLEGTIAKEQIGENGFGYDPVFFVPRLGKTVAQLSPEEKNAISHRGEAIRKLKPLLKGLL